MTTELTSIISRIVNNIYQKMRIRLTEIFEADLPLSGEIEVFESYFGSNNIRGKRERRSVNKNIIFGLLKR